MCKTYDAVYELAKHAQSNILICFMGDCCIEGTLYSCEEEMGKQKCYDEVITLKDVKIKHHHAGINLEMNQNHEKEFAWLNIPSKHIKAFAFKCCEK